MYKGTVQGKLTDDGGVPIGDLAVTLCGAGVCLVTKTDQDGGFLFEQVRPASHVLENIGYPGDDQAAAALELTRFFDFVSVELDEQVVLSRTMIIPSVAEHLGPLSGSQQLTLAGGLEVSFDADLFGSEDNPLPAPAEALHFGAIEIPKADWPTGGLNGWKILRAWGTAVWDLHHEDAFAVVAPLGDAGPLAPNAAVAFLVADYTYGFEQGMFFEETAELTEDGTAIRTPSSGGLDRSTLWLAVTKEP